MSRSRQIATGIGLSTAIAALVTYAADSLVFTLRQNPVASVTVQPYLAVPQKNGRIQFMFEYARNQPCVRALFPHRGISPCWYLRRHTEQRTKL